MKWSEENVLLGLVFKALSLTAFVKYYIINFHPRFLRVANERKNSLNQNNGICYQWLGGIWGQFGVWITGELGPRSASSLAPLPGMSRDLNTSKVEMLECNLGGLEAVVWEEQLTLPVMRPRVATLQARGAVTLYGFTIYGKAQITWGYTQSLQGSRNQEQTI